MNVRIKRIFPSLAALLVFITACSSATPAVEPVLVPTIFVEEPQEGLPLTDAEVPRISLEDGFAAIQSGEAVVVDVRNPESYQGSHIAGAISVPLGQIDADPTGLDLDKEQWIITYCT